MPSGRKNKAVRSARSVVSGSKPKPWGTVLAVLGVVIFAAAVFGFLFMRFESGQDQREALAPFTPSAENQDPSRQIDGVVFETHDATGHVRPGQRVAYDRSPPFGGPHASIWAACNGVVYSEPVRTENMVHALEHGSVWITYNPELVSGDALASLRERVEGRSYMLLSPYPGLDSPVSLQSWGHQLKVDSASDPRIDQFIQALRLNQYMYPEVGASCDVPTEAFDPANPPPFNPAPPGPDAVGMDFNGGRGGGPTGG
ncbi:MAG: DUF3105 domain-containing protein [Pseudonocardiaceae bacterium]|nr:DUF3105 domain-containing protein [Pseudonocardiaceae bacterium]